MGASTADIPVQGIAGSRVEAWASEIRDFLLGRPNVGAKAGSLPEPRLQRLEAPPVLRWWIFEGKVYALLGGGLAANFPDVMRHVRRLDQTFNPRLRLTDRPEGEVDWGYTLARGRAHGQAEYVVRSSGIGLDEAERSALRGWVRWLDGEWTDYVRTTKECPDLGTGGFGAEIEGPFDAARLRRWAHIARRSRWPLFRSVMAESLRPVLEPEELDRIPLPDAPEKLFELLCLVRIARHFEPAPRDLRWLHREAGNVLRIGSLSAYYQQWLPREKVLETADYRGELAQSIEVFGVRVPGFVDLAFDFDRPLDGFHGILVEAKSGSQQYAHAVAQLRTYAQARERAEGSRYLLWGIVERSNVDATPEQVLEVMSSGNRQADVWVFSSADRIPDVLGLAFRRDEKQTPSASV